MTFTKAQGTIFILILLKSKQVLYDVVEKIEEAIFDGCLTTGQICCQSGTKEMMFCISCGSPREDLWVLKQKYELEVVF